MYSAAWRITVTDDAAEADGSGSDLASTVRQLPGHKGAHAGGLVGSGKPQSAWHFGTAGSSRNRFRQANCDGQRGPTHSVDIPRGKFGSGTCRTRSGSGKNFDSGSSEHRQLRIEMQHADDGRYERSTGSAGTIRATTSARRTVLSGHAGIAGCGRQ